MASPDFDASGRRAPVVLSVLPKVHNEVSVRSIRRGPALRRVISGSVVTVLALGELSAGKLVATPGGETFAHEVFKRMHYGVTNHLAALCLVLLAMVAVPGAVLAAWGGKRRAGDSG